MFCRDFLFRRCTCGPPYITHFVLVTILELSLFGAVTIREKFIFNVPNQDIIKLLGRDYP